MSGLNKEIKSATKWSTITEVTAKLITPATTMVLARILTPENFGVLVTATMIISFAEIFTDAGFQKYIIQHQFKSKEEKESYVNVAFWSNFIMSILIWGIIVLFSEELATILGNEGHGAVISISCLCIPLAAFSSIQMSLFKKSLNFKTLFKVRIVGIMIPIFVTIPIALLTRDYWALIAGMIALQISNAILLTINSEWKPKLQYSFSILKNMLSFSIWSMIETLVIWLGGHIDLFVVGTLLSQHYLGIYRTSMTTVNQIMFIITAATTPILFSSLSRLQNNKKEFDSLFFRFQKIVSLLVMPVGVCIFIFRDFITKILLGSQWTEGAYFLGLWGLTSSVTIVLSHYSSEVYRAKGKPKLSVFSHMLHIAFVIPVILWAINYSFDFLCTAKSLARLQGIIVNLIIMSLCVKISAGSVLKNVFPSILAASLMLNITLLPETTNVFLTILYIFIAISVYLLTICLFKEERALLFNLKHIITQRKG